MLFPFMKCFTGMFRLQGDGREGDRYLFISISCRGAQQVTVQMFDKLTA